MYRRIRDLRDDSDLTQKQVAQRLCCSQQAYSNYELGLRDIPTEILIALAKMYNTTSDYILELSNERERRY
ncbi:MAG: helix-turn-helix transcriptional regulator [Oscillospiraceae bacterium]|nr:helix-turn-helix transcriptional regulator [Oscillospiraceae bacterium]